jgi:cell division septum initiation protein DivIVA
MTKGDDKRSMPTSELPGTDLRRERDEILSHFTGSPRFSDDLSRHHEQLLQRVRQLEEENAALRAHVEADSAIRDLVQKIEVLEREKEELKAKVEQSEASGSEFGQRVQQFEEEFANLANLFVASTQLHSCLSPRGVMRRVKDVLAQLIGAECYVVYMTNPDRSELVPIASEGVTANELGPLYPVTDRLKTALDSGTVGMLEGMDPSQGSGNEPAALVPLCLEERVVGLAVIHRTLEQKRRFETVDLELFKLLGQQAATALVSASLYSNADRRVPGLEAFMDLSV